MGTVTLAVVRIERGGGTQSRAELNADVIAEYADLVRSGVKLPPVLVFHDGERYWLADGFHRVAALESAGKDMARADVRQGTQDDAVWESCGANKAHGLRRTNADKHRAVEKALQHPNAAKLSDRAIAEHCGVSYRFVGKLREAPGNGSQVSERRGADGKVYDTSRIAEANRQRAASKPAAPRIRLDTTEAQDVPPEETWEPPEDEYPEEGRGLVVGEAEGERREPDVFDEVDEHLADLAEQLRAVRLAMVRHQKRYQEKGGPAYERLAHFLSTLPQDIKQVEHSFKAGLPYEVCPFCKATYEECPACYGTGWVTRSAWEGAPEQLRETPALAGDIDHWKGALGERHNPRCRSAA